MGGSISFFTCAEHDNAFTESVNRAGIQPPRLEHYIQERELFGFFISGQASLESFAYSCYCLGAILNETQFPMTDPRKITFSSTIEKYQRYFKKEPITEALKSLKDSPEFDEWSTIRNINAHRLMPGRLNTVTILPAQPNLPVSVTWATGIQIDNRTTTSRREWLSRTLNYLLDLADAFTQKHLQ